MQSPRLLNIGAGRECHPRMQYHSHKASRSVRRFFHHPFGMIDVRRHNNPRMRAQMQVPQLVACRQRNHQQFLRIPTRRIPPKIRIRRTRYRRLLRPRRYLMPPFVISIPGRPAPGVPGPFHADFVMMCLTHSCLPRTVRRRKNSRQADQPVFQLANIQSNRARDIFGHVIGNLPPFAFSVLLQNGNFGLPIRAT